MTRVSKQLIYPAATQALEVPWFWRPRMMREKRWKESVRRGREQQD